MVGKKNTTKNEYLFLTPGSNFDSTEDVFIILANNEHEAIYKAATIGIKEDSFNEHVYTKSINMSFAEEFTYADNEEIELFSEEDCELLVSDDVFIYEFKRRVNLYFKDNKALADEYIAFFFSEDENEDVSLSDDLLINIWIRQWSGYKIIEYKNITRY